MAKMASIYYPRESKRSSAEACMSVGRSDMAGEGALSAGCFTRYIAFLEMDQCATFTFSLGYMMRSTLLGWQRAADNGEASLQGRMSSARHEHVACNLKTELSRLVSYHRKYFRKPNSNKSTGTNVKCSITVDGLLGCFPSRPRMLRRKVEQHINRSNLHLA
jgi:hypothetical protein